MVKDYLHSSNPKCEIIEYTITEDDVIGKPYFEKNPVIEMRGDKFIIEISRYAKLNLFLKAETLGK
jgi:hypothetical protein